MSAKLRFVVIGAVALITVLMFVGCEINGEGDITFKFDYADPVGYVINVKTGQPISGAEVTLRKTASTTPEYKTLTASDGKYSFTDVNAGEYELTATLTGGYAFTKKIVEVASNGAFTLPQIGGFIPDRPDSITIFVFWDGTYKDIDAHLTFPQDDSTTSTTLPTLVNTDFYRAAAENSMDTGFLPEHANFRGHIYHLSTQRNWDADTLGYTTVKTAAEIYLDIDNTGAEGQTPGGPETITINGLPYTDSIFNGGSIVASPSYTVSATGDPSGLDIGTYYWIGVMEYYLNAYSTGVNLSTEGSAESADAVVYVFSGTTQKGVYTVPTYTGVKTASMLRINMFYGDDSGGVFAEYQILPDIRTFASDTSIRGIQENSGIVTARCSLD